MAVFAYSKNDAFKYLDFIADAAKDHNTRLFGQGPLTPNQIIRVAQVKFTHRVFHQKGTNRLVAPSCGPRSCVGTGGSKRRTDRPKLTGIGRAETLDLGPLRRQIARVRLQAS